MKMPALKDGRAICPWCPTTKRVRVTLHKKLYRHQPYSTKYAGGAVAPCAGSGRNPASHPKYASKP